MFTMKFFSFFLLALPVMAASARHGRNARTRKTSRANLRALQDFTTDCTCADKCGLFEPTECGCWCDAVCEAFGDCCADLAEKCDIEQVPVPSPTPTVSPWPTPDWGNNDDMIPVPFPDTPTVSPYPTIDFGEINDTCTCANVCGSTEPTSCGCWCDAQCVGLGDCCSDATNVCSF